MQSYDLKLAHGNNLNEHFTGRSIETCALI